MVFAFHFWIHQHLILFNFALADNFTWTRWPFPLNYSWEKCQETILPPW